MREQTLEDGGHYERSPQYHSLMLENYLDIYQLLRCCDAAVPEELIEQVEGVARAGLDWLCDIVFPDKQIPLFNDSAFSVAPDLIELQGYAQRLFAQGYRPPSPLPLLIDKSHSGLYGYRASDDMLLVDCGDIGPSYQPGHSHCDFLSYELMLDGHRIVVDSGVYEYQTGAMRDYVRSTAAHMSAPLADVLVFSSRQAVVRNGEQVNPATGRKWANTFCFAWFVWRKGYTDKPRISWLP